MNPLQTLTRAQKKIRREGAINSVVQVCLRVESYLFDIKYGVDTYRNIPLSDLEIGDPSKKFGNRYQPILVSHLRQILNKIGPTNADVLVDVGSGKGRVLLISAMYPFKKVVGVEFSQELCDIANRNAEKFQKENEVCPIEVHCTDAAKYAVDPEETIFFFFNPFDTVIMSKVISNIEQSYKDFPRRVRLVFLNMKFDELNVGTGLFQLATDSNLHGLPFQIYEAGSREHLSGI